MRFFLSSNRIVLLFSLYAVVVLNAGFWQVLWQGSLLSGGRDW